MPRPTPTYPGTVPSRKLTPGITIRVFFHSRERICAKNKNFCWDYERWVDIIRREGDADQLLCETTRKKDYETYAFCFSPSAVRRGDDPIVERFELGDEPEEKEELREDEVRRLHEAVTRPDMRLDNRKVKTFRGFITAPSQYYPRAVILDTNASSKERDDVELRLERLMMRASASLELINLNSEMMSMLEFDPVAMLTKLLSKSNKTLAEYAASLAQEKKKKPVLTSFQLYKCYAEFECVKCPENEDMTNVWSSAVAWGVYKQQLDTCSCCESRKAIVGCVHVLKDPWECEQTSQNVFVPANDAQQPRQGCRHCGEQKRAILCEVFYDQKPSGRHMPEYCPACRRRKTWCRGAAHKEDILRRLVVAAHFIKECGLDWKPSPAGLEATAVVRGWRILFQIRPWLFMLREHQTETEHQPHTLTGREPDLLRGDRMVVGSCELQLLKRALIGANAQFSPSNHDGQDATRHFDDSTAHMGGRLCGKWRAYSFNGRVDYGAREGIVYYKPSGWVRKRLNLSAEELQRIQSWPILWHGTTEVNAASIVFSSLHRPGSCGVQKLHGQARSETKSTIYLSPCLGYASHPVYAQFFNVDHNRWGQLVLQCKARPRTWRAERSTLKARHWPPDVRFDPHFENHEGMEYLFEDTNDVVVFGLMYREFGPTANALVYGDLVTRVHDRWCAPEFCWTALLEADYRAKGLLTTPA